MLVRYLYHDDDRETRERWSTWAEGARVIGLDAIRQRLALWRINPSPYEEEILDDVELLLAIADAAQNVKYDGTGIPELRQALAALDKP